MNHTPYISKNAGFIDFDSLVPIFVPLSVFALIVFALGKSDFDDYKNCRTFSESVKELSENRNDDFVADASILKPIAGTEQPTSFWLKSISKEMNLVENDDYIAIGEGKNKRYLFTIDAVIGFSAKAIESSGGGGFFYRSKPERYQARRILDCLQKPYFPKAGDTVQ